MDRVINYIFINVAVLMYLYNSVYCLILIIIIDVAMKITLKITIKKHIE